MGIDLDKMADLIDDALADVDAVLTPVVLRVESEHGTEMAINLAMNVGADILANSLGRIKNPQNRKAALIGHVLHIAKNMEIVLAEHEAAMLIQKIQKETKT